MRDCFIYLTYSDSQLGVNGDSVISLKSANQTLLILRHVRDLIAFHKVSDVTKFDLHRVVDSRINTQLQILLGLKVRTLRGSKGPINME